MFDVGFSELVLIGVVALVVLGPARLPGAARTAGALLRRARSSWANVRAEVERELAAEELKRSMRNASEGMDVRTDLQSAMDEVKTVVSETRQEIHEHPPS
jgi:sec-independent protein translocase protein TatB